MTKELILKKAIIFEQQGKNFYINIAENTESGSLREIFRVMAEEETKHEHTLKRQLAELESGKPFAEPGREFNPQEFNDAIITEKLLSEISGASYEAGAVSAAMGLEIKSAEYYSSCADKAENREEKNFFRALSVWENSHLKILSKINRDLLENALNEDIY